MKKVVNIFAVITIIAAFLNPVQSQDTIPIVNEEQDTIPLVNQEQDTITNLNQKVDINGWPETAQKAANAMMEKYGDPHETTPSMLIWHDTAPFTKTIVYKEEIQHDFPMPHKDVLEQIINHDAPVDKYDEIAEFDGSVILERTKGTIAARCDKEAANILALNLAHDILEGKKEVQEARQYYADAIMKFMQGEKDPYLESLTFQLPNQDVNNPDETILDMSKVKEIKEKEKNKDMNMKEKKKDMKNNSGQNND